jgi:hypothetical protein
MPYAETTDRPNVGEAFAMRAVEWARSLLFSETAQPARREQIRVRWDDKLGEAAPDLAHK